jgi:hypothetical protein
MDALERKLVRADTFLWHLVNVGGGVAIFVATVLYVPPGSRSVGVGGFGIDPFYLLVAFAVVYSCWTGIEFWKWYADDNSC